MHKESIVDHHAMVLIDVQSPSISFFECSPCVNWCFAGARVGAYPACSTDLFPSYLPEMHFCYKEWYFIEELYK